MCSTQTCNTTVFIICYFFCTHSHFISQVSLLFVACKTENTGVLSPGNMTLWHRRGSLRHLWLANCYLIIHLRKMRPMFTFLVSWPTFTNEHWCTSHVILCFLGTQLEFTEKSTSHELDLYKVIRLRGSCCCQSYRVDRGVVKFLLC